MNVSVRYTKNNELNLRVKTNILPVLFCWSVEGVIDSCLTKIMHEAQCIISILLIQLSLLHLNFAMTNSFSFPWTDFYICGWMIKAGGSFLTGHKFLARSLTNHGICLICPSATWYCVHIYQAGLALNKPSFLSACTITVVR